MMEKQVGLISMVLAITPTQALKLGAYEIPLNNPVVIAVMRGAVRCVGEAGKRVNRCLRVFKGGCHITPGALEHSQVEHAVEEQDHTQEEPRERRGKEQRELPPVDRG